MYAFITVKYEVPIERILQTVDRHRAYLRELHAAGRMVCSGPFVPRWGGALLLRIGSESEVQPVIDEDPFFVEKLASYSWVVWDPNIGQDALEP
jgi:uncharacterized protein YciI